LKNDLTRWLRGEGENLLRSIGVREGQTLLDFGCGSGNYAIPASKVVGEEGMVFAVDKRSRGIWPSEGLVELRNRAKSAGLSNIVVMKTSGELDLTLEAGSVDFVLLFDVLHSYYFPDSHQRKRLLSELHRVLKPGGILSLYPGDPELAGNSRETEKISEEIQDMDFCLIKRHRYRLLHENKPTLGTVLNFAKC